MGAASFSFREGIVWVLFGVRFCADIRSDVLCGGFVVFGVGYSLRAGGRFGFRFIVARGTGLIRGCFFLAMYTL